MSRALALALLLAAVPARPDGPGDLSVDPALTAGVTAGALALWGAGELAVGDLAPSSCRWCEPPGFDREARARLAWSNRDAARLLSDGLVLALPAALALSDFFLAGRDARLAAEDVLVAAEAMALAGLATQIVKLAVGRRRPDAWAAGARTSAEDDLSFFSGHASLAFAAAGAFGTVAKLRGYSGWPAIYAAGFAAAAAVAYFRVAGDKHWLSDVAAGAAAGAAIGIAVPVLLHRRERGQNVAVTPLPLGIVVVF